MPETVLITGASGFIGAAVARRLAQRGYAIRAVSRHPARHARSFADIRPLPGADVGEGAWQTHLAGIDHVVHCAGIARADGAREEEAYRAANERLTATLARAAAQTIPGRFVFLSSIFAVAGPPAPEIVDETTPPRPYGAYGRSKRNAEEHVRAAFGDRRAVILRPVAVYGRGATGAFSALAGLAKLPLPLPLAALSARRSLLDVEACAEAVAHAIATRQAGGAVYTVCDRHALTIPQIVSALRRGYGRRVALFPVPTAVLAAAARLAGRGDAWRRLSGDLVADPSALAATGWKPVEDSAARIERLARESRWQP